MTAQSAARHTVADLRFVGVDPGDWIVFEADSASRPGHVHTILYDRATKYAECSGTTKACRDGVCWHRATDLLEAAYVAELARQYVARALTLADVEAIGRQARARVEACGDLWMLVSPLDAAILEAARAEYRKRDRARREVAALLAQMPSTEALAARRLHTCPDCGEMTPYRAVGVCDVCWAEIKAERAGVAA